MHRHPPSSSSTLSSTTMHRRFMTIHRGFSCFFARGTTMDWEVEMQELQDNEAMKCEGEIVGSWSQEAQRELTHRKPVLETRRPTLREWQAVQMTWRMCRAMRKLASLMDSSHAQQRKVLSSS
ncbi:hypothetical protein GW17_00025854 [Ensete ventricosum]|nr:hypothetical protein GW17_00025854 [Ensete ventricosum]